MTKADIELYENRKWCLDNDFKVFVQPIGFGSSKCNIVVQRGGISTDGLPGKMIDGVFKKSKTVVIEKTYKNQDDAFRDVPNIEKKLREKYG
jgi:hypothetical protein